MHRTIGYQGLLALAAVALTSPAFPATSASTQRAAAPAERPAVEMELLADVSHVTPGAHFQLAVHFEIPEHCHIYWQNPGFRFGGLPVPHAALPTRIEVEGPEGYTIGEALYPGPRYFEVAPLIRSYGYEESVCLLVPVSAPLSAQVGSTADFRVKSSWTVCQQVTTTQRLRFPQSADSRLKLSVATRVENQVPRPTHPELFKHWRARLPRPQAELAGVAVAWSGPDTESPALELHVSQCDELEFFPARDDTLRLLSSLARSAPNLPDEQSPGPGLLLTFDARVADEEQPAAAIRGVLRVRRGKQERFYRFATPLPGD